MFYSTCLSGVQGCYLLHFERPIFGAQHYLGWALNVERRVALQARGGGARLVRQALHAGIAIDWVRTWPEADRKREYALKRRAPKSYCPTCRESARQS